MMVGREPCTVKAMEGEGRGVQIDNNDNRHKKKIPINENAHIYGNIHIDEIHVRACTPINNRWHRNSVSENSYMVTK